MGYLGGLIVGRSRWRSPSFSWIRHYGQPQFRLECVLRPARRKDRALRSEGALSRTDVRRVRWCARSNGKIFAARGFGYSGSQAKADSPSGISRYPSAGRTSTGRPLSQTATPSSSERRPFSSKRRRSSETSMMRPTPATTVSSGCRKQRPPCSSVKPANLCS